MSTRPNILFIMSDEHDPAVTGCYGDPLVQTPNLDRLAARGVLFDGCYCNSPLCVPSRQSFTAGRYVSRVAAWNNGCCIADDRDPTLLPRVLREAGYTPYLAGKQHYEKDHRYGFVDLTPWANQAPMDGKGHWRLPDETGIGLAAWHGRAADFHPGDSSKVIDADTRTAEVVRRFLADAHRQQAPWFLFAGFNAPHFPLIAPQILYERYRGKVPMPVIPDGLLDRLPLNYRQNRLGFGSIAADPYTTRHGRELYWALVDWFDGLVGTVLSTLAASAVAEDTVVIYTADHGENKGDHGLWWKNCLYEHGARVPLLVSWPARWAGGQRRSGACTLVDVVRTIADLAGTEAPGSWDGDSLLPWLDDPRHAWKDTALAEYYGHNTCGGITMWREGTWKYVLHNAIDERHPAERELYDLATDPRELANLAADPAQVQRIARMHAAMLAELGEDPQLINARCAHQNAVGYGPGWRVR